MNIILEYVKKSASSKYHFELLLRYNDLKLKKLLKYKGTYKEYFSYTNLCVFNSVPILSDTLNNKSCSKLPLSMYGSNNCTGCWIELLENIDEHLKLNNKLPAFLKVKETPKFLK